MFLLLLVLPTIICTFSARKYFSLTDRRSLLLLLPPTVAASARRGTLHGREVGRGGGATCVYRGL